ncbi:MAG: class I SAM-dependent methyltransferase [Planctomycetia bacterium]|nr:class I SAM-dependent methyltransferase [Planctomycetia bacterium]
MEKPAQARSRPDYGIDAPGVVRNLFVAGSVALLVSVIAYSGMLPWKEVARALVRMGASMAVGFLGMGSYMFYSSKVSKLHEREWLLDLIPWRGDETVLDVGCGRGLMLIGAAKRLTTGTAAGIDIWQTEDLSGNHPDAPLENARLEGVADRVTVSTADMRQIPFPDGHFDVIVSNVAIHNLYQASERAAAVREIARVLKPGGACVLADVLHEAEYASVLRTSGVTDVQRHDSSITSLFFAMMTLGRVRPFVLVARKP